MCLEDSRYTGESSTHDSTTRKNVVGLKAQQDKTWWKAAMRGPVACVGRPPLAACVAAVAVVAVTAVVVGAQGPNGEGGGESGATQLGPWADSKNCGTAASFRPPSPTLSPHPVNFRPTPLLSLIHN